VTDVSAPGAPWWRSAVIYQVYLRSFADGSGDGVGDLAGLRSRLDHLDTLGVDALWITPWYPSPMRDGGYDVVDHRGIHPVFGTLDEARRLIDEIHGRGLRIVIDIVANHTSSEHPWFRAALASAPGSPEREYYHFRDGAGPGGDLPPNDWISAFGGSAWTRVPDPGAVTGGQWYLHLFSTAQPDLNWDHPDVRAYFESVLRFWFDLGVDGLRVDAAPGLAKRPGLPDHGFAAGDAFAPTAWESSPLWDVDAVHDIYRTWRAICDGYPGDRMFVGEVPVNGADRLARYLRAGEFHTAFNLDFIKVPWRASAMHAVVDETLTALGRVGAPATWVLSSHDEPRHVTRYGRRQPPGPRSTRPEPGPTDRELGLRRARAAVLLMLALPGGAYLYQGEELGLEDVEDLPPEVRDDPIHASGASAVPARDACRVPLPWSGAAPPFGFTAGPGRPWLPQPARWADRTVAAQDGDPGSVLALYRAALDLRHRLVPLAGDTFGWRLVTDGALAFGRGHHWECLVNLGGDPVPLGGEVMLSSGPLVPGAVPADTAVWVTPY